MRVAGYGCMNPYYYLKFLRNDFEFVSISNGYENLWFTFYYPRFI